MSDLGHKGVGHAVAGDELGPFVVDGYQGGIVRIVDEGHPRQVNAEER